jgi:hypothetical protein
MKSSRIYLLALMAATTGAWAQIKPTNLTQQGGSVEAMAAVLVGRGVTITNVQYTGAARASGLFCDGTAAVGLDTGILLTTGDTSLIGPPNNAEAAGVTNGVPGDADLNGLIPGFETFDASVLEFDFIPVGPTVTFQYVFASEEYNEFVDSLFNDVFGFFVNGVNYALLPDSVTPVSINNVNNGYSSGVSTGPCVNCQYFVDNTGGGTREIQYDGLTTVLTFTAPVVPGTINKLKIAIADAGDDILDSAVFIQANSLSSELTVTNFVTRDARFWFEHPYPNDVNCVNLRAAIQSSLKFNCDQLSVDLGFMSLPVGFRNNDNIRDADDATLEALGLYWRKQNYTGELGGTQHLKYRAARICRDRKQLAVEMIAALANINIFNTRPEGMTYDTGKTITNFPATLIEDARAAAASDSLENIAIATGLLRKFNRSGITNQFPSPLIECNPQSRKELQSISRDPTDRFSCPGPNDDCDSAQGLVFPNDTFGVFGTAKTKAKADTSKLTDQIFSPSCGQGGPEAVWKLTPTVARASRRFTVDTRGSNFDTLVSIYQGPCDLLTEVACNDDAPDSVNAKVSFNTDGTNTYFIVVEGKNGAVGNIKLSLTSP